MATLQTVIGVYIYLGEGLKDFYERVPVSTKSTVKDVVVYLVRKLFGDVNPEHYGLYEAEYIKGKMDGIFVAIADHVAKSDEDLMFLKGETVKVIKKITNDIWEGECEDIVGRFPAKLVKPLKSGTDEGVTQRKFLRVLGDTEIPLFVGYNWKYQKEASNLTFLLKEREAEVRENATKEFYVGFSKPKLQGLLDDLEAQQRHSVAQIDAKYDKQLETYRKALEDAKAKRSQ